jgi:Cof subfamily protein (haloacid dehalogenase superfamily)
MVDLVAFDLDGTILDHSGRPARSALSAIRALVERGIPIASISGRSVRRSLQPLSAHADFTDRMHICGYNGAAGVGPLASGRRSILYVRRLAADVFAELVGYASEQDLNLVYCRCDEDPEGLIEEYRFLRDAEGEEAAIGWTGAEYVLDPGLIERIRSGELEPPPKIMLFTEPDRQEQTIAELQGDFGGRIYATWAVRGLLEIMPTGADKGVALQALSQATGVPAERIMAIGDGNNDLPMLRQAGLSLLMGSADPQVREAVAGTAVRLARTFAEDGFARAVREHVL